MKQFLWATLFVFTVWGVSVTPGVTAQESVKPEAEADTETDTETDEEAQQKLMREFVARAERLREFGYPLLAREQLDNARAIDATAREVLLGYLRLYTLADAEAKDTEPYVKSMLELYPNDYESCLEIARFIAYTQPVPTPPSTATDEELKLGLDRLKAEMAVFRELGQFISQPGESLPETAKGKPGLASRVPCSLRVRHAGYGRRV